MKEMDSQSKPSLKLQAYQYLNNSFEPPYKTPSCCWGYPDYTDFLLLGNDGNHLA